MKRELRIIGQAIDEAQLLAERRLLPGMGAVVHFLGVVRGMENDEPISGIHYEAFKKMAEHQFELIFKQIEQRWPIGSVRVVHCMGFVKAGMPSLWVEMIAPHRAEALEACGFLIDEMKRVVPIWKHAVQEGQGTGG